MYTSSSRGSKRKADKNVDADFTSCLALERENPLRQPKAENRETDCSEYSRTRHSRFFSSVSNTDNNSTTERLIRIPLGACSLVVWQCIAFATSFLLASQTTSVAATASCMTTSYTTTKLSHAQRRVLASSASRTAFLTAPLPPVPFCLLSSQRLCRLCFSSFCFSSLSSFSF